MTKQTSIMFVAVNDGNFLPTTLAHYAKTVRREVGGTIDEDPLKGWERAKKLGWRVAKVRVTIDPVDGGDDA